MSLVATQTKPSQTFPDSKGHDPLLSNYYRDVGTLPVLQAEQEFEFSRRIEELELELWAHLLAHPQLLEPLLRLLEGRMEQRPAAFSHLRRACTAVRQGRSASARQRHARWCELAAAAVRADDVDRITLDLVLEHLQRLADGDEDTLFGSTRASTRTAAFRGYLQRASELGRSSQRARNEFVQANLRLVVTIARRFNFKQIPLNDLIQEGNIGLIKAVGRFDHRRGYRFSTYASWWIRHAITRAMADKGRLVRVPVHMLSTVHKVTRVTRDLASQLGRQPTSQEIASTTSIEQDKVEQILEHLPSRSLSLDNKVNEEDDRRFIEMVVNEDDRSPVDTIGNQQVFEHVREIIHELQPMEKDILQRRFGLDDGQEHTLVEIGVTYDLSRERIRQIQERALGKIRRALMRRNAV